MIAVLSYYNYEQGTDPVVDWLLYYNADFVRLTMHDLHSKEHPYSISVGDGAVTHGGKEILDKVSTVWYRRFYQEIKLSDRGNMYFPVDQVNYEVNNELEYFVNYLFSATDDNVNWMPSPQHIDVNKLTVLKDARSLGMKTPRSIVTNNKADLIKFYNSIPSGIISKPINHSGYFVLGKYTYAMFTTEVNQEMIDGLPDRFFPTLFQERVTSEYEIRIFYLDGQLYSTAILNSNKEKHVDIKLNYKSDGISWVNYQFPKSYEAKLIKLMQKVGLNTGSIDVIKNEQGEYVFLEVNPVGQYSAPSDRCNYEVERLIAQWLINKDSN